MFPGNTAVRVHTADKTTLRGMLAKIRARFGAAERLWVMDRGVPTEEILAELRATVNGQLAATGAGAMTPDWIEVRVGGGSRRSRGGIRSAGADQPSERSE